MAASSRSNSTLLLSARSIDVSRGGGDELVFLLGWRDCRSRVGEDDGGGLRQLLELAMAVEAVAAVTGFDVGEVVIVLPPILPILLLLPRVLLAGDGAGGMDGGDGD